jgi:hypothetical protein
MAGLRVNLMATSPSSQSRVKTPTGNNAAAFVVAMPSIPGDVKKRFPSMQKYEDDLRNWVQNLNFNLGGNG